MRFLRAHLRCLLPPAALLLPPVLRINAGCVQLHCGQCGGDGCGAIVGTAGASDCCPTQILNNNQTCGGGVVAPCIVPREYGTVDCCSLLGLTDGEGEGAAQPVVVCTVQTWVFSLSFFG